MISDEYQTKASYRNESAAESMRHSADRIEQTVWELKTLLEDGYGNNCTKLIELLQRELQR